MSNNYPKGPEVVFLFTIIMRLFITTIVAAAALAFCLPLFAQPKGLPLHSTGGRTVPINQMDTSTGQVVEIPKATQSSTTATARSIIDLNWLDGATCPENSTFVTLVGEYRPLCSNGIMLTPEGPEDVHCEYLYFSFYRANFNGCDLTGMDFRGLTLQAADFTGANLTNTNFSNTDLRHARFMKATVIDSRFDGANLASSHWEDSTIDGTTFVNANMVSATIRAENFPLMVIRNSSFKGIKGPLYTKPGTHWINTICADGNNSEINPRQRRTCTGEGVVLGK